MSTHTAPRDTATLAQVLEVVRYTVRSEHEARFLEGQPAALAALQAAFPSLLSVTTAKLDSADELTTLVDVAVWTSHDEAARAASQCMSIPAFASMMQLIVDVQGPEHGVIVGRL